jgi:hypothetical protein
MNFLATKEIEPQGYKTKIKPSIEVSNTQTLTQKILLIKPSHKNSLREAVAQHRIEVTVLNKTAVTHSRREGCNTVTTQQREGSQLPTPHSKREATPTSTHNRREAAPISILSTTEGEEGRSKKSPYNNKEKGPLQQSPSAARKEGRTNSHPTQQGRRAALAITLQQQGRRATLAITLQQQGRSRTTPQQTSKGEQQQSQRNS